MTVLLLGGTGEAVEIGERLTEKKISFIYSLAQPTSAQNNFEKVHYGGFGGVAGLEDFIQQNHVTSLIDATHPFAEQISQHAALASQNKQLPRYRYLRPAWKKTSRDNWFSFDTTQQIITELKKYKRPFITLGRSFLKESFQIGEDSVWTLRCIQKSDHSHVRLNIIAAKGPFSFSDEQMLFQQHDFDVLVCKNSGGESVDAKLAIARERRLPVLVLERPKSVLNEVAFSDHHLLIEKFLKDHSID